MALAALNWKELELLVARLRPEVEGLFVEQIAVPERPRFPKGFIKGEWSIRLSGRKREATLLFSARPRHPYLTLLPGRGPRAAAAGTHSAFDLALSKQVRGLRLASIEALPRERAVLLWFGEGATRVGLALLLIPATPEAALVRADRAAPPGTFEIVASTRSGTDRKTLVLPDGVKAPEGLRTRDELVSDAWALGRAVHAELEIEAFELRRGAAERAYRDRLKQARERLRQAGTGHAEALKESDWRTFGELLKATLSEPPPIRAGVRQVYDFRTGSYVDIPCDPKLSIQDQVEKFFQLERRKRRRLEEAGGRIRMLTEDAQEAEAALAAPPPPGDWSALERFERQAGIEAPGGAPAKGAKPAARGARWPGRCALSRDGLAIWVGRSRDENLELTFKCARGNDLWMHVRGRPGAHVVIPVQSGKSIPLETLLDGALLAIHFSGGDEWGKTEVDYTFRKHVKRIRDSTEVSYTGNKTLIVEGDPERLKALLARE